MYALLMNINEAIQVLAEQASAPLAGIQYILLAKGACGSLILEHMQRSFASAGAVSWSTLLAVS